MQLVKDVPQILGEQTTQTLSPTPSILPPTTVTPKGEKQKATVTKVVDGDTINVSINGSIAVIRLIGIDTPELVAPNRPVECFGKEASAHAIVLVKGKTVYLIADNTQDDIDKYGRLLRYVFLEDGMNINKQMIADGYAYEYTYDAAYIYQNAFREAERMAREQKKGLWSPDTCNGQK